MRRDNAARTKVVRRYNYLFLGAVALLLAGVITLIGGIGNFNRAVAQSSSPIGTTLNFKRSSAITKIAGIYTDEAKSVLVVRIAPNSSTDGLKLPYKGTDYTVYVASAATNSHVGEQVPVLFGRYSTNGDLFLVIPKPTTDVYTVYVMNRNFVNTSNLVDNSGSNPSKLNDKTGKGNTTATTSTESLSDDEIEARLMESMNNFDYRGETGNKAIEVDSDLMDVIGFRVTLDPSFTTDDYVPKTLKGTLLDGDGNFDFKSFFEQVFKGSATSTIEDSYNDLTNQRKLLVTQTQELQERLSKNPNDKDSQSKFNQLNERIDTIDKQLSTLAEQYTSYSDVQYDPSLFTNLQDHANVINAGDASKLDAYSKAGANH